MKIATIEIDKFRNRIKEKNINVVIEENVIDYVCMGEENNAYGARPLKRKIESLIEDKLAEEIINNNVLEGENITVSLQNDVVHCIKERGMDNIMT